jgi:Ca-activated chloride channel family protein
MSWISRIWSPKLSDLLLSSGFGSPYAMDDDDRTMQALHDAILDALFNGGVLPEETIEKLLGDPADGDQADARSKLEELIQQIIERMGEQGYITAPPDLDAEREHRGDRGAGREQPPVHFRSHRQDTGFPWYRALRDLLGSLGKSSFGRHDTREQATGIETTGAPKPYQFGDTLNLDPASTLLNAVQREAREAAAGADPPGPQPDSGSPIKDLMVVQGEYQSSCATVLMLDCSHSMILYGEDRFTPAKRVALALAQLIKHQYPGDALKVVLFHDSAEEIPLAELGRVRVGPTTRTRARDCGWRGASSIASARTCGRSS